MRDLVIAGAGGSGREIVMLVRDIERAAPGTWHLRGVVTTTAPDLDVLDRIGVPYLGDAAAFIASMPAASAFWYSVGIGDPLARRRADAELREMGGRRASLIHPSASIDRDAQIGPGAVICAQTAIATCASLGASVQVNVGCTVGHDAVVRDFVTLGQAVVLAGRAVIEENATVHTGALVEEGVTIGASAVVGAGAVVTGDVSSGATVVGVPARRIR